jgi:hypothetical protein
MRSSSGLVCGWPVETKGNEAGDGRLDAKGGEWSVKSNRSDRKRKSGICDRVIMLRVPRRFVALRSL